MCRSEYSAVMERVALKKLALMILTPDQVEQEYLARHYEGVGIFHMAQQNGLDMLSKLNKIKHSIKSTMDHIPINDTKAFRQLLSN